MLFGNYLECHTEVKKNLVCGLLPFRLNLHLRKLDGRGNDFMILYLLFCLSLYYVYGYATFQNDEGIPLMSVTANTCLELDMH